MPRKEINDYIFYKIVCLDKDLDLCYVGSTANWKQRVITHKYNATSENSGKYNTKLYQTIRENGGWDNFKMIQLGTREKIKKREAERIEEEYRVELRAIMNSKSCFKLKSEYYKDNKDKILEYKSNYYDLNKDKILAKQKVKVECECGCIINSSSLTKHKKSDKHLKLINAN